MKKNKKFAELFQLIPPYLFLRTSFDFAPFDSAQGAGSFYIVFD